MAVIVKYTYLSLNCEIVMSMEIDGKSKNRKLNSHHKLWIWELEEHLEEHPRYFLTGRCGDSTVIVLSQTPHELMKRIGTWMCKDSLINRNILQIENHSEFNPQIQCKAKQQMPSLWWMAPLALNNYKVASRFFLFEHFIFRIRPIKSVLYFLQWRRLVEPSFYVSCAYICFKTWRRQLLQMVATLPLVHMDKIFGSNGTNLEPLQIFKLIMMLSLSYRGFNFRIRSCDTSSIMATIIIYACSVCCATMLQIIWWKSSPMCTARHALKGWLSRPLQPEGSRGSRETHANYSGHTWQKCRRQTWSWSSAGGVLIVRQTRISMDLALTCTRMLQTQMWRVTAVGARWQLQTATQVLQIIYLIHKYTHTCLCLKSSLNQTLALRDTHVLLYL